MRSIHKVNYKEKPIKFKGNKIIKAMIINCLKLVILCVV